MLNDQRNDGSIGFKNATMTDLVSIFVHEINQPLMAIIAYSRSCLLLIKNKQDYNELLLPLENIAHQAQHAGETIHAMNKFIRDEHSDREEADINIIIKQSISILNDDLLDVKLKITLNLMSGLPKITINKIHIMRIILNLARNSIEALQSALCPNPELVINTRILNDSIVVCVIDNGPGISAEFKHKILNTSFTTKPHGSGIGLRICQSLIEANGGKLSVQDNGDNNGAWFSFGVCK